MRNAVAKQFARQTSPSQRQGKLYQYFEKYLPSILAPEITLPLGIKPNDCYVEDDVVTEALRAFKANLAGTIHFLTGLKGIGKTTHIRYVFADLFEPKLSDDILTIPFYLQHYIDKDQKQILPNILGQFYSAADLIQKTYTISYNALDFVHFIEQHRLSLFRELLLEDFQRLKAENPDRLIERLRTAYFPGYISVFLKYFLTRSSIKKCIIIADDLEGLSTDYVAELLSQLLSIRQALLNIGDSHRSYEIGILIACRTATYHYLKSERARINGITFGNEIRIQKAVDIAKIIEKRFDVIVQKVGGGLERANIERWRESYTLIMEVISKISSRHGDLLIGLCNYDLRRTLLCLNVILRNSYWFMELTKDAAPGAFSLSSFAVNIAR